MRHEHTGDSEGFSWSPCDRCGSRLGGERHYWQVLEGRPDGGMDLVQEGRICVDCLYEVNYGHKPEEV